MSDVAEPSNQERAELPESTARYLEYLESLNFWPSEDERVRPGLEPENRIYRQMPEDFCMEPEVFPHADHMTRENLYGKWEIAAELGWRDKQIADLTKRLAAAEGDTARLEWMQQGAEVVSYALGGFEVRWDNKKTAEYPTIREAIDAARSKLYE